MTGLRSTSLHHFRVAQPVGGGNDDFIAVLTVARMTLKQECLPPHETITWEGL